MTDHLTPLDASFLELEEADESSHMHVGWAMVFDPLPGGGTPSLSELQKLLDTRLSHLPRFRRRLSETHTGGLSWPDWVDDDTFDIATHVRRAALPEPGGRAELLDWLGDFYSHRLERTHPLWKMTLLEGLEGGRWAIAVKVHHCLVDGISGVSVTGLILDAEPEPAPDSKGVIELMGPPPPDNDGGSTNPLSTLARGARAGVDLGLHPGKMKELLSRSRGVADLLVKDELRGAPKTSLNVPITAHRRLAEVSVPLDDFKAIKNALGGTVNDVVLAASTGALRRLFENRGEEPPRGVRAMVPVSMRQAGESLALGNRVSSLFVELPAAEPDPRERYRQTVEATESLKHSDQAAGAATVVDVAGLAPPVVHAAVGRLSLSPRLFNVTITNVPGSPATLYALGAPLRHIFPLVPIFANHAVGIAITSYDGEMVFGINADRDAVPDLDVLERGLVESIDELREVAGVA